MNPKLIIGLLVLAVLTVIPTIVDGQRRFRWGQDTETLDFVKKLNGIPKKFGDWECTSESELSPTSLQLLTPFNSIMIESGWTAFKIGTRAVAHCAWPQVRLKN